MKLSQNWVGYLDRSYQQIKKSIIKRLVINNPEVTDHSESNILIVIISFFSGIAEMLNYYIDNVAKESFLGTAKKYSSVIKLTRLIDYRVKARSYPTVALLFRVYSADILSTTPVPIFIPKGTIVSDVNGIQFKTIEEKTLEIGQSGVYVQAAQFTEVNAQNLGASNGSANQKIALPDDYVNGSLAVVVSATPWNLYGSFGQMINTTKGYVVDIEEDGVAYVKFGDGVNGAIPTNGNTIYGTYLTTRGSDSNNQPETITKIVTAISVPNSYALQVTNPDYAVGGTDFESIDEIRDRAPRSIRTIERAVTYQDYIDICLQVPGIGSAEVRYCCGKYVDVYVIPNSKGNSTQTLLDRVNAKMNCAKMVTTKVSVKPSGISKIWIKAKIYGNALYEENAIKIPVINAIDDEFGFNKVSINRKIAISDIIRVMENLEQVDRVEIEQVRILPYARPTDFTKNILNIVFNTLPLSAVPKRYTVIYKAISNSFEIYLENTLKATKNLGETFNDGTVDFQIVSGSYSNNDTWNFSLTPSYPEIFPAGTIDITDYSAPIVDVDPEIDPNTPRVIFSNLTFITQGVSNNCLPPC